jgi:hypothetical protein
MFMGVNVAICGRLGAGVQPLEMVTPWRRFVSEGGFFVE